MLFGWHFPSEGPRFIFEKWKKNYILSGKKADAASVLVWNATHWGDAIRAANAIPLLFSS